MEEYGVVKTIVPVAEDYDFQFDENTCHYLATGRCPVEALEEEIRQNKVTDFPCKCVRLIQSIIHEGFIERNEEAWIRICSDKEKGINIIDNGRHRICAACKLLVSIKVHIHYFKEEYIEDSGVEESVVEIKVCNMP